MSVAGGIGGEHQADLCVEHIKRCGNGKCPRPAMKNRAKCFLCLLSCASSIRRRRERGTVRWPYKLTKSYQEKHGNSPKGQQPTGTQSASL